MENIQPDFAAAGLVGSDGMSVKWPNGSQIDQPNYKEKI